MTNTNDVNYRPQAETYAPNVRQANTSTSSSDTCNAPHQSRPAPRSTCHRRRARHRAENQTPTNDAGVSRLEDEDEEASEPRSGVRGFRSGFSQEAASLYTPELVKVGQDFTKLHLIKVIQRRVTNSLVDTIRTMFTCLVRRSSQYKSSPPGADMVFDEAGVYRKYEDVEKNHHATGDATGDCDDKNPAVIPAADDAVMLACKIEQQAKKFLQLISNNEFDKLKTTIKTTFQALRERDPNLECPATVPESLIFICECLTYVLRTQGSAFDLDVSQLIPDAFYRNNDECDDLIDAVADIHNSCVVNGKCICPQDDDAEEYAFDAPATHQEASAAEAIQDSTPLAAAASTLVKVADDEEESNVDDSPHQQNQQPRQQQPRRKAPRNRRGKNNRRK